MRFPTLTAVLWSREAEFLALRNVHTVFSRKPTLGRCRKTRGRWGGRVREREMGQAASLGGIWAKGIREFLFLQLSCEFETKLFK